MNIKLISSVIAIFLMLISPALSVLITEKGQADNELVEKENTKVEVSLLNVKKDEEICLDLEEYICGVLMSEVCSNYPDEALMANAVAVRSYVLRRVLSENKGNSHSSDVCDSPSHCLAYISKDNALEKWGDKIGGECYLKMKNAVDNTKGQVLYYEDNIAECVFHASSYKYTESAENVWGTYIPYLVSVETYEECSPDVKEYNSDQIKMAFSYLSLNVGDEEDLFGEITENGYGRVENIVLCGNNVSGADFRKAFCLNSSSFEIEKDNDIYRITSYGRGHSVGMSQEGSKTMAEMGKSYKEILEHYYPGTQLKIY